MTRPSPPRLFIPIAAIFRRWEFWKHARLETAEACVEAVQWKLTGIERKIERQHSQMDIRILVPGEADVSYLALGFRPFKRAGSKASASRGDGAGAGSPSR